MPRLQRHGDVVHVAFDASKNVLVAGILRPGEETATIERVFNDEPSIRRFVKAFPEPGQLRTCYEAQLGCRGRTPCQRPRSGCLGLWGHGQVCNC